MIASWMERLRRPGGLQKQLFVALLIVGIVPGVAALFATYLYSKTSLEQSIGSGFQEIARSTAIRIAAAVDGEIDRAERLAIVPIHVQKVLEAANRQYEGRRESDVQRLLTQAAAAWPRHIRVGGPVSRAVSTAYLKAWAGKSDYYLRVTVADRRGAVIVSTPQDVGLQISMKTLRMFQQTKVPLLGIVENMSWFEADDGKRYELFGAGGGAELAERLGVPLLGQVPLVPALREGGDAGAPIIVAAPGDEASVVFRSIAERLDTELAPKRRTHPELRISPS